MYYVGLPRGIWPLHTYYKSLLKKKKTHIFGVLMCCLNIKKKKIT